MNVVVYAEGTTEEGAGWRLLPSPGSLLQEEQEGPIHLLVRRAVSRSLDLAPAAIRFVAPLRRADGAHARGSDLLRAKTLKQLLTWSGQIPSPDLAVVLVDHDGEADRLPRLRSVVHELPLASLTAIGVAIKEFEAWLTADHDRLRAILGRARDVIEQPEDLAPGEAKRYLGRVYAESGTCKPLWEVRRILGGDSDLDVLERRCRSFREFTDVLKHAAKHALEVRRRQP